MRSTRFSLVDPLQNSGYSGIKMSRYLDYSKSNPKWSTILHNALCLPLPALLTTAVFMNMPVQPPEAGAWANYMVFIQLGVAGMLCGAALGRIFTSMIPEVPFGLREYLLTGTSFGIPLTLAIVCLSILIGYPVPFAMTYPILFALPTFTLALYYIVGDRAATIPRLRSRIKGFAQFISLLATLILIYPALTVFTLQLKDRVTTVLMSTLFPIVKFTMRYLVQRAVKEDYESSDLAVCLSIIGIDFYASLYLANLLQAGANAYIMTTILMIDVLLNIYEWRSVQTLIQETKGCVNARVLYRTELLVVIEYVEAVVPLLYMSYSWIAYTSVSHQYFNVFGISSLTVAEMQRNSLNLLLLVLLEGGTLAGMLTALAKSHKLPVAHIFGFCLKENWHLMAGLMMIIFMNLVAFQAAHYGTDFTFQFAWLHDPD